MLEAITPESVSPALLEAQRTASPVVQNAPDFGSLLGNLIQEVDAAQKEADHSLKNLAANDAGSLQELVSKMEEADLSFHLMKEVRNKLTDAYREIMKMNS